MRGLVPGGGPRVAMVRTGPRRGALHGFQCSAGLDCTGICAISSRARVGGSRAVFAQLRNRARFTPTSATFGPAAMPTVTQARDLWVNPAGTGIAQFANAHFVSPDTNFTELRTGATAEEYPSPVLDLALVDDGPTGPAGMGPSHPRPSTR